MKSKAIFPTPGKSVRVHRLAPPILKLSLALSAAILPSAQAALLVSEPFDYTPGTYAGGSWSGLTGSGIGWGSNIFFDHAGTSSNFIIGGAPLSGGYFKGDGQNNSGSYFRNRVMSPWIHNSNAGSVLWQSVLMWTEGTPNGGGLVVHNANGGTNYNIRLGAGNVYELRGGHNNSQGTTDEDVSTIVASSDVENPDFILVKVENASSPGVQNVSVWINPDVTLGKDNLPAPDLSVSYRPFYDGREIGGINIAPGSMSLDEILFGTEFKDVTSAIAPVAAYNPVPADGGTDISVTRTLRWSNADADSYKVFFWKSNESKPSSTTATTTEPLYDPPTNLDLNTAYSWQVVVVKGSVEVEGPVWTFETGAALPPGSVSTPQPVNAATEVVTAPTLTWNEASRATSYDVFIWPADGSKPGTPTASVAIESYTVPSALANGTSYHWQVEAVNDYGRDTASPVWQFTTELLVNTPSPANASTQMLAWRSLGWAPAPGASSYDVYVWKDGTTKPGTPTGNVTGNQYTPYSYLEFGATYHWQVVANLTEGGTSEGPEWAFTTQTEGQVVASPPFDISPSAQAARLALYDNQGRAVLTGADTELTSGMKISFFGDSITWQDAYLTRIRTALSGSSHTSGLGVTLINHGVNGGGVLAIRDGVPGDTNHFGGTEPKSFAYNMATDQPNVVVLFIGINDVWWRGTSEADFEQALRDIVAQARDGGATHFVMATPWLRGEKANGTNVNDAQINTFAAICEEVAEDTGSTFVNLHELAMAYLQNNNFTLEEDGTISYLENGRLTYDGVHPSNAGNDFLADQLSLAIHRALTGATGVPISVKDNGTLLIDGNATPVSLGTTTVGTSLTKTFTISNGGEADLSLGAITKDGADADAFTVTGPVASVLAPGEDTTFTVAFSAASAGARSASIHIASDAPDALASFDIAITATALSLTADTDGDGLSDGAEFNLAALGFDWQVAQSNLVNALLTGAKGAGLHRADQVHALQLVTPSIVRDPATGEVALTLSVEKAAGNEAPSQLEITAPQATINDDGELEIRFAPTEDASFFRVEGK
jgi:lysophospholipase L1-like esterase